MSIVVMTPQVVSYLRGQWLKAYETALRSDGGAAVFAQVSLSTNMSILSIIIHAPLLHLEKYRTILSR